MAKEYSKINYSLNDIETHTHTHTHTPNTDLEAGTR
jgi:hypothetical protein